MAFGNKLGVNVSENINENELFSPQYGYILAEIKEGTLTTLDEQNISYEFIGDISNEAQFTYKDVTISLDEALETWTNTLEDVFPTVSKENNEKVDSYLYDVNKDGQGKTENTKLYVNKNKVAKP